MPQVQEDVKSKGKVLKNGKQRPNDTTTIEWVKSPFHKAGTISVVHPVMATKLIESGKAKLAKKKGEDDMPPAEKEVALPAPVMTTENTVKKGNKGDE